MGGLLLPIQRHGRCCVYSTATREFQEIPECTGMRPYQNGLAVAWRDKAFGYVGSDGQWAIPPQFEAAMGFTEGLAAVMKGGAWGYIDPMGRWVVSPQYCFALPFSEGVAVVHTAPEDSAEHDRAPSVLIIDGTGRKQWEHAVFAADSMSNGLIGVRLDRGWCYLDRRGRQLGSRFFGRVHEFGEGLAHVMMWDIADPQDLPVEMFIDTTGEQVLVSPGVCFWSFREGLAVVGSMQQPDRRRFIDRTGAAAFGSEFEDAHAFYSGAAAVTRGGLWGCLTRNGRVSVPFKYTSLSGTGSGFRHFVDGQEVGYVTTEGTEIVRVAPK